MAGRKKKLAKAVPEPPKLARVVNRYLFLRGELIRAGVADSTNVAALLVLAEYIEPICDSIDLLKGI